MISTTYSFKEFVEKVKDMNYLEIISTARREADYLEPRLTRVKGAVERRKRGGGEYVARLKEFIFFLSYGIYPSGVPDWAFRLYLPVCKNLINKGQLKPSVLEFYNTSDG